MLRHIFRKEGSLRSLLSLPRSCAIYGELWKGLEKSWGLGGPVVPWDGAGHLCPAFEDRDSHHFWEMVREQESLVC